MTLSPNDVSGERQEAYVLIPLGARDADPSFWGWATMYSPLPTGQLEHPINLVDMGSPGVSRIYFVPERGEFRLCTEVYRLGAGYAGCLLVVSTLAGGGYETSVLCEGVSGWSSARKALVNITPSGTKHWGYM